MEAIELIELIARGEDSRTQFKQDVRNPESLAGDLVAFSNSKGGKIIIGVSDQGVVVGLSAEDIRRINQLLSNTATNLVRPSINPTTENIATAAGQLVMVVSVPEGLSKPYSDSNGVFWVKSGSDKRRVTSREEIQRLLQSADLVHADEVPVEGTTVGDVDADHVREFFEKQYGGPLDRVLERDGISLAQLLHNLGLARDNLLNLAGLMLFGRHPQRHRPAFVVKAVSFVGNDPAGSKYRDSEDIPGCLRNLHKGMMSFLTRNLRRVQGNKGINTEGDLEVPASALEELVVNMLLHRDYFISAPWRVFVFDNRIELISPGSLPNNLTIENIRNGVSLIRNPLIASFATKELPYRGIGTGIRRALAAIPALQLESDHERNLFTATIPRAA
ncbi:MAG TPA: putative DNA binding domain-containing protein [Verrucomicrobiota bacterium]|jgi:ATP-dependent DNA helicase RecG|nr:putative DNA binding domain-containing protein [Verrucomicrobiota bacterium]HRR63955.1 putative DNA binding domain-containing protein [Candidatus Paceibacterota bacterium]HOM44485.1 putative DNA binding domain-containing protein [Verrucomicrobiota bacterium]HOQ54891.1 putative DNA binding domain-containing protein [Verrucomicrobiota bacterium]HPC52068.1 putative DNA binding domain-containing protein [Verrucomicrobiota bacterium]